MLLLTVIFFWSLKCSVQVLLSLLSGINNFSSPKYKISGLEIIYSLRLLTLSIWILIKNLEIQDLDISLSLVNTFLESPIQSYKYNGVTPHKYFLAAC